MKSFVSRKEKWGGEKKNKDGERRMGRELLQ